MHIPTNSVAGLADLLRSGALTPREIRAAYRARIREIDPLIRAYVEVAADDAWDDDGPARTGVPHWLPFGVKDIIDVAGLRTRAGSRTRADIAPARKDAAVVARLRAAGFVPLGKTATTEFAFRDPAATRNPHNLAHSPGGSSSGSGAAVAAGLAPLALGTQTAGSLCRPAAYCGVAAVKPSLGRLPTEGVVPLAVSFDTVGVITRRVTDAAFVLDALGLGLADRSPAPPARRLGVLAERFHSATSAEVGAFHDEVIRAAIEGGATVATLDPPVDFDAVISDHRLVMLYEAYRVHGPLLDANAEALGPRIREALREGAGISEPAATAARNRLITMTKALWQSCVDIEALILQPVPATAPVGRGSTGNQSYLTPWTVFGGPLVVVPGRYDRSGLPMAVMIAAAPERDQLAVATGAWLSLLIDQLPDYVTPASTLVD